MMISVLAHLKHPLFNVIIAEVSCTPQQRQVYFYWSLTRSMAEDVKVEAIPRKSRKIE